jgi:ubiquinone biosynthesis protein Coq4
MNKVYLLFVQARSAILVFLTHQLALPVLKIIRKPEVFPYSRAQLHEMQEGTLGKDLISMLDENNFSLLTHYARHDIKHILLGYPTTDEGEVSLQMFMLGNGQMSFPVLITVLFGSFTMPEYWSSFIKAYQRGKKCAPVNRWNWFALVPQHTLHLQNLINQ